MMLARMYGGPNGYGHAGYKGLALSTPERQWVLSTPGPKRSPFSIFAGSIQKIAAGDLRPFVQILDQGQTSSCTGHAEVGSASTFAAASGRAFPYPLSPWAAYRLGLMIDQPVDATLFDQGAIPEQVTRGCQEWGLPAFSDDPTNAATINTRPSFAELEKGLRLPITGIYGCSGEDQIGAAIDAGYPVKFGSLVDVGFEQWSGGDPYGAPNPAQILGGHAIYAVHRELVANVLNYWIANSWGTGYGESGFVRVSSAFIQQVTDAEVVRYGVAP